MVSRTKIAAPKAKKKFKSTGPRSFDEKYTGEEPVFIGWEDWDVGKFLQERRRINYYYSYHSSTSKLISKVAEWMKLLKYDKSDIKLFKEGDHRTLTITHCGYAAARCNGMPPKAPAGVKEYVKENYPAMSPNAFMANIDDFIKAAVNPIIEKSRSQIDEDKPKSNKISPIDRLKQKVNDVLFTEWDKVEDLKCKRGSDKVDSYSILTDNKIPVTLNTYIIEYINERLEEIKSMGTEEYDNWSKPQVKKLEKFWNEQLDSVNNYFNSLKTARKSVTRAKKAVPVAKQVAKLKYLADHKEYQMKSIMPSDIPASNILFLFNTKTRRLTVLHSDSKFTVSGSTIKNIDEDLSFSKTVRKPETLNTMICNRKGYAAVKKSIDGIKSVSSTVVSGRTNEHTIILRGIKP